MLLLLMKRVIYFSIKDLEGKRFAFGEKNSSLPHFVPRYMLLKANISLKNSVNTVPLISGQHGQGSVVEFI